MALRLRQRFPSSLIVTAFLLAVPAAAQVTFGVHVTNVRGDVQDVTVGDANDDGFGDVVIATQDVAWDRYVFVLAGGPAGNLRTIWSDGLYIEDYADTTVDFAPVVGPDTGPLDLVLHNTYPTVRFGAGDGSFEHGHGVIPESGSIFDGAVGEFNGDGETDTAVLLEDWGGFICFAMGTGDGHFMITWLTADNWSLNADLEYARLDDNIQADPVVADDFGVRVVLLPALTNNKKTLTTMPAADLAVVDLDGDGHVDPAYTVPGGGSLGVSPGYGDGTFSPPLLSPAGTSPDDLAVADLDGDGVLDVAITDPASSAVRLLLGQGNGTFSTAHPVALADAQGQIVATDVNADGLIDLVLAHATAQKVTTLINLGGG